MVHTSFYAMSCKKSRERPFDLWIPSPNLIRDIFGSLSEDCQVTNDGIVHRLSTRHITPLVFSCVGLWGYDFWPELRIEHLVSRPGACLGKDSREDLRLPDSAPTGIRILLGEEGRDLGT